MFKAFVLTRTGSEILLETDDFLSIKQAEDRAREISKGLPRGSGPYKIIFFKDGEPVLIEKRGKETPLIKTSMGGIFNSQIRDFEEQVILSEGKRPTTEGFIESETDRIKAETDLGIKITNPRVVSDEMQGNVRDLEFDEQGKIIRIDTSNAGKQRKSKS